MDWLEKIRNLDRQMRSVKHSPFTPRYQKANIKLDYLLRSGRYLGVHRDSGNSEAIEIACWAPQGHGRGPGFFFCFRIFLSKDKPTRACLFCFYDGTENSPRIWSVESASTFAANHGFQLEEK